MQYVVRLSGHRVTVENLGKRGDIALELQAFLTTVPGERDIGEGAHVKSDESGIEQYDMLLDKSRRFELLYASADL